MFAWRILRTFGLVLITVAFILCPGELFCEVEVLAVDDASMIIDGKLTETVWEKAKTNILRYAFSGEPVTGVKTEFKVLCNKRGFIFGIECEEPRISEVRRNAVQPKFVYDDDCIEIFMDPSGKGKLFFQYLVNGLGTIDRYRYKDGIPESVSIPTPGLVAKGLLNSDSWTLEVQIPFVDMLGIDVALEMYPVVSSGQWNFNIVRNRRVEAGQMMSFSNQMGNWRNTALYQRLSGIDLLYSIYNVEVAQDMNLAVEKVEKGFLIKGITGLRNKTGKSRTFSLNRYLLSQSVGKTPLEPVPEIPLGMDSKQDIPFSAFVSEEGKYDLIGEITTSPANEMVRIFSCPIVISSSAISVAMEKPYYRSAIYHTMDIGNIAISITKTYNIQFDRIRVSLKDGTQKVLTNKEYVKVKKLDDTFSLPLPKLQPGTYDVVVEVFLGENQVAKAQTNLYVYDQSKYEVRVNENLNLVINGREVFPVGFFGGHPYLNEVAEGAINYVACYTFDKKWNIDELYHKANIFTTAYPGAVSQYYYSSDKMAQMLKPLSAEQIVEIEKWAAGYTDTEGIGGWYLADEPDPSRHAKEFLEGCYRGMREGDPYHPCFISFNDPTHVEHYNGCFDIVGTHCYLGYGPRGLERPMTTVVDYLESMKKASKGKVPCWFGPQVLLMGEPALPFPYREERCMTLLALVHGAKGIYWTYASDVGIGTELRLGMQYLVKEIRSLEKFVLSPNVVELSVTQPENKPVHFLAKKTEDNLTMVFVNTTLGEVEYSVQLPGLFKKVQRLFVVCENRGISVKGGNFKDKLGPYEARILTTDEKYPKLETVKNIYKLFEAEHKRLLETQNLCYLGRGTKVDTNTTIKRYMWQTTTGYYDNYYGWGFQESEGSWLRVNFKSPQTVQRIVLYSLNLDVHDAYGVGKMSGGLQRYELSMQVSGKWINFSGEVVERYVGREIRPGEFVSPVDYNYLEKTHLLEKPLENVTAIKLVKLERNGMVNAIMAYAGAGMENRPE